jgi:hypothetical protein
MLDREQLPPILRQWVIARAPRIVQASTAGDVREAALSLAKRFFEAPPEEVPPDQLNRGREPVLLMGLHPDVGAALVRAGLPPAAVWRRGSAGGPAAASKRSGGGDSVTDAPRCGRSGAPPVRRAGWLVFEGLACRARRVVRVRRLIRQHSLDGCGS